LAGISGVESGKAAPLVGGPPGMELHTRVEELPSGAAGEMFPVVVRTIGVGMVPRAAGVIAAADIVGADAVIAPVVLALGMGAEKALMTVDDGGMVAAVTEGDGSGGSVDRWGAGTVEPG
jgi:hypothetical protein